MKDFLSRLWKKEMAKRVSDVIVFENKKIE